MTATVVVKPVAGPRAQPYDYWWNGVWIANSSAGRLILTDVVVATSDPTQDRRQRQANPVTASLVPYRIGRYYQAFDVSTVAPPAGDATVDRARPEPSLAPPSAVPYRISRYYQDLDLLLAPVVGDATLDHVRPQAFVPSTSSIPNRIGRYYVPFADLLIPPVTPDNPVDRTRPQANVVTPSAVPYRIGRYYSSSVDVINTVTEPTDHGTRRPYVQPAPSVANRIQRYYTPQQIDTVGDQPTDHAQPRPQARVDVSRFALAVRRYYLNAPPDEIMGEPGIVTVTFSGATTTTRFQSTASTSVTLA